MLLLGFWQLRRLDEKRDYTALVEARQAEPAVDVADGGAGGRGRRRARRGRRAVPQRDGDRRLRGRRHGGRGEPHLQRRLRGRGCSLRSGSTTGPRCWSTGGSSASTARVPSWRRPRREGEVTVEGLVLPSQERGRFGPTDPPRATSSVLARVDLDRLRGPGRLRRCCRPTSSWSTAHRPKPPCRRASPPSCRSGRPDPSEGPHLAYAVQWFIFTTIAAGGYVLLLRRRGGGGDQAKEEAGASADSLGGPPEGRW